MAMYQIGDIVTVRPDLSPGVQYKTEKDAGHYAVTEAVADMFSYAGKKVEIASFDNGLYGIKNCFWNWTAEMFEGLVATPEDPIELNEKEFLNLL